MFTRRQMLQSISVATTVAAAATAFPATALSPVVPKIQVPLRPRCLKAGDTIGLVSPSMARYERTPFAIATENMKALGFKVKEGQSLRARNGYFAGSDAQRAGDLNAMFADPDVDGIVAMSGGAGATRILNLLDYDVIRRNPKCLCGFSDITALLNAIQARTGLVTFHGPMAASEWNEFTLGYFRRLLLEGEAITFRNPVELNGMLTQLTDRTQTVRGGRARGRLLGGNLSVLNTLLGTPYQPDFRGAILVIEDVDEYIYRVDRMLAHLRLAGVLDKLAGVVIGQFVDCKPGEGFGRLSLEEVFDDYLKPLNIPVYSGAMFGHIKRKFTLPIGLEAEMDADACTLTLSQPAVI
ncbi:MAG: LD-carboxypeptidase [Betaproteobacteria bacterium]